VSALVAQTRAEVFMTLFFSTVHVVATPHQKAVDFFVPGILALAVMSTAMVSLGIATGFERGYGVLKRLGSTPLGRSRLLGAKIATIVMVEILQAAVLIGVGFALGWNPGGHGSHVGSLGAVAAALLASVAFGGIGLFLAGVLKAEVNLAAANGLYLVLLLLGGMVVPIAKLPSGVASVAKVLPADALAAALHAALGGGTAVPTLSWVVLAVWAIAAPLAAALSFRWE
jgi:ABC-2 type transport system permease protein